LSQSKLFSSVVFNVFNVCYFGYGLYNPRHKLRGGSERMLSAIELSSRKNPFKLTLKI